MTVQTRAALTTQAGTIRDETTDNANTATRIGTMHQDTIDSMVHKADGDDGDDGTLAAGSPTINFSVANHRKCILAGNITPTFTMPTNHVDIRWTITQNGTGGFTITWPAIVSATNAANINAMLSTLLNTTSVVVGSWDGT